jgi:peroxiredoxin
MLMKNTLIAVAVICGLVMPFPASAAALRIGDKAPALEATTLDGKKISSGDLKDGEGLFLFFWTTWCPFCIGEIPVLKDAYAGYSPKGMKFLAINPGINDSRTKIERYIEKYRLTYPIALDEGAKIAKSFGVRGVPTYVMVDKDGIVQYRGNRIPTDLAERVEKMTRKPDKTGSNGVAATPVSMNR